MTFSPTSSSSAHFTGDPDDQFYAHTVRWNRNVTNWSEPNKQNVTWHSVIILPWSVSYTRSSTRLQPDSFTAGGAPAHVNMSVILLLWSWCTEWKAATNNDFFYIIHYSFFFSIITISQLIFSQWNVRNVFCWCHTTRESAQNDQNSK